MSVMIITDSSADYEQQELRDKNIVCVPLTIAFGDDAYLDGVELAKPDFYNRLLQREIFPTTSQPSPEAFAAPMQQAKDNGDGVVAILLSAGLSGTVQSANIAKDMVKHPDAFIVDSRTTVAGLRILVDMACAMRDAGESAQTIAEAVETLKSRVTIFAVVDTLEYLHRGGRLTKTQAKLGQMVSIKPIITIAKDGKLVVVDKALGFPAACKAVLKHFEKHPYDDNYPVFTAYSHDDGNEKKMEQILREAYPGIRLDEAVNIGPVIGTHLGDNAFGIIYISK